MKCLMEAEQRRLAPALRKEKKKENPVALGPCLVHLKEATEESSGRPPVSPVRLFMHLCAAHTGSWTLLCDLWSGSLTSLHSPHTWERRRLRLSTTVNRFSVSSDPSWQLEHTPATALSRYYFFCFFGVL